MPDNRQVQNNGVSDQSADNIEEAVFRLKINDNSQEAGLYREELPERTGQPDCGYFIKTGTCKYGSTCKYHHPKDGNGAGPVILNILGLPMRQDEKSCPYYMRTGSCKFGIACKFHHPQPASPGAGLPVNGPVGSSILPPSGVPYAGGLPPWSLPRAPYVSGPRLQSQSYMPVVVSPSQSMIPAPGWSTYMGTTNPVSSAAAVVGSNFPERPDQPECRYYMNTGTCKYGSDCKYHHPKERIANLAGNGVGPLGLPSRPGQAVCSSYTMYGLCKYGPTCRFDHPYVGYPYSYGLSLPLPMFDSSALTYQRMSPTARFSETPLTSDVPDWAQNNNSVRKKHQSTETKNSDDPADQAAASPHSLQISSKTSQDN